LVPVKKKKPRNEVESFSFTRPLMMYAHQTYF
jgi:hypothetical protein